MNGHLDATRVLELAGAQAEAAELYEVRSYALPVRFRAGGLASIRSVETAGRALRLVHNGCLGFSTTTDMADARTLVENALASAQFGDPTTLRFPAPQSYPAVQCFDPAVEGLEERQLIDLGKEVIDRLKTYNDQLQVDVSLDKRVERIRLLNTSALALEDRRSVLALHVHVMQTREDDILVLTESSACRRRADLDGAALTERLIERLRWCERGAAVPSGSMPVVFNRGALMVLLLPLIVGLDGRQVYLGGSPLAGKLGQQVLDERIKLFDDGRLDFAARSAPWDDEGIPTSRKPLVEGGYVRQFLYDLRTATQAGAASTGNGLKQQFMEGGYQLQPAVAPTNWLVAPGEQSLDAILGELDEALLVEEVLGLGQGNVPAGEFSNNLAAGFLVRRGEIVGRVKNTMIAGNVYELLKDHLIALGDQPEWVFGTVNCPAVAVDAVGVAAA